MATIVCAYCGKQAEKLTGEINRANKAGLALYCGRECSGLGRRANKPIEQRRAEKAAYDKARRDALGEALLAEKRAAYYRDHDARLAKAAEQRACPDFRAKMKAYQHAWIRRPTVKAAKKQYDRRYRAVREFGETDLAEAVVCLRELNDLLRPSKQEIRASTGRINLCQTRKRRDHVQD